MEGKAGWPVGFVGPVKMRRVTAVVVRQMVDVCSVSDGAQSNLPYFYHYISLSKMESIDSRNIKNFLIFELAF